jgi:hypothetical protein
MIALLEQLACANADMILRVVLPIVCLGMGKRLVAIAILYIIEIWNRGETPIDAVNQPTVY